MESVFFVHDHLGDQCSMLVFNLLFTSEAQNINAIGKRARMEERARMVGNCSEHTLLE